MDLNSNQNKENLFNEFSNEFESFVWLEHFNFQKNMLKNAV